MMNQQTPPSSAVDPGSINIRDIHLPEPISWWPLAPGWWLLLATILTIILILFIVKKVYQSKQLKRDISTELESIKQTFQQTQNKSQLVKSLSILLRRVSLSYYPNTKKSPNNIAGLTGEHWLAWLDETHNTTQKSRRFQSNIGHALINAPYLPDDTHFEFDTQALIDLSESWLLSKHTNAQVSIS